MLPRDKMSGMGMRVIDVSDYDHDFWNGRLLIWEEPMRGATYAMGVDPAGGVGRDRSVVEVIKVGTLQHPDIQVAEFACDFLTPIDFSAVINEIGKLYSDDEGLEAYCSVECNTEAGASVANDLRMRLDYSNLYIRKDYDKLTNQFLNKIGWWTTRTSRPQLLARGIHAFTYGDILINSDFLLAEMSDFRRDFIGVGTKAQAKVGSHDDRVMALLIGYWAAHDDEWMNGDDIAEERRARAAGLVVQKQDAAKPVRSRKASLMSMPLTMRQAQEKLDEYLSGD